MKKSEALKILGLAQGVTDEEIKKAHRKLVIAHHPDKYALNSKERADAEELTKQINEARDVLLQRSWTPEFDPRRDARPYANNPYVRQGGQTSQGGASRSAEGNPFSGSPFGQGGATYVWTSWDNIPTGTQKADGFDPFDPFAPFRAQKPQKSAQEVFDEAKKYLRQDALAVVIKGAVLAGAILLGALPIGLFLYAIVSLIFGLWKRFKSCLVGFFIPFAIMVALVVLFIAPRQGGVTLALGLAFAIALLFDLTTLRKRFRFYRAAKSRAH